MLRRNGDFGKVEVFLRPSQQLLLLALAVYPPDSHGIARAFHARRLGNAFLNQKVQVWIQDVDLPRRVIEANDLPWVGVGLTDWQRPYSRAVLVDGEPILGAWFKPGWRCGGRPPGLPLQRRGRPGGLPPQRHPNWARFEPGHPGG